MNDLQPLLNRRNFTLAALFPILLIMVGCNVTPTYQRPDVPVPQSWSDAPPGAAIWPSAQWWHAFGSGELDHYMDQATQNNNDLAAAIARVRQTEQQATIAGAALYPNVAGSFDALNEHVQSTNSTYNNFRQLSPQVTASYMLDFWGGNRATRDAALATAAASRHDKVTVELTVMSGVAQNYFQIVALKARLSVAQQNLKSAQSLLQAFRKQMDVGVATALDVAQQETVVANLDAVIPPLIVQLRQAQDALAILVGATPQSLPESSQSLAQLTLPPVNPGLPSELLQRRPDVAEAEDQLIAANADIGVARAAFFPSISLTGSAGYSSSQLAGLTSSASIVHSAAAGIALPIFEGGAIKGQYEYAKAKYDELLADYRKAILTSLGNAQDALTAMQQSSVAVERLQVALDKADRADHIARAQLQAGTVSILTVLNTEGALFTAQDALIQAKNGQLQAYVNLFAALGGGWKTETSQP